MAMLAKFPLLLVTLGAGSLMMAQVFAPPQVRRPKSLDPSRAAFTVGEDEPGCKDSLLLPRVAGCSILQCNTEAEDRVEIHTAIDTEGTPTKDDLEGASEVIYYLCPAKVTHSSIIAAAEAKLAKEGYAIAVRSKDGEDEPLITAMKDRQWVQISTYTYEDSAAYIQTALLASPEQQSDIETVPKNDDKLQVAKQTVASADHQKASKAHIPLVK